MSKRTDPCNNFPWSLLLSGDDSQISEFEFICNSKTTSSVNIRKAVTVLEAGAQSGTKEENCQKLIAKARVIESQLNSIKDKNERSRVRQNLIDYYISAHGNKCDPTVQVLPKPIIPITQELKQFVRERSKSPVKRSRISLVEDDEIPKQQKEIEYSQDDIYNYESIAYYNDTYDTKTSVSEFYKEMLNKYPSFTKEKARELLKAIEKRFDGKRIPSTIYNQAKKLLSEQKPIVVQEKKIIVDEPKLDEKKEQEEKLEREQEKLEREREREIQEKLEREQERLQKERERQEGISVQEIKKLIQEKGWEEPRTDDKTQLYKYVVQRITDDLTKMNNEKDKISDEYRKLRIELQNVLQKLEDTTETLAKKEKKLDEANKMIERLNQELKQKTEKLIELEDQIQLLKKTHSDITGTCMQFKDWIDQDKFDLKVAEHELTCPSGSACNIDTSQCMKRYVQKPAEVLSKLVIGSENEVDKLLKKINKRISDLKIEEEEAIQQKLRIQEEEKERMRREKEKEQKRIQRQEEERLEKERQEEERQKEDERLQKERDEEERLRKIREEDEERIRKIIQEQEREKERQEEKPKQEKKIEYSQDDIYNYESIAYYNDTYDEGISVSDFYKEMLKKYPSFTKEKAKQLLKAIEKRFDGKRIPTRIYNQAKKLLSDQKSSIIQEETIQPTQEKKIVVEEPQRDEEERLQKERQEQEKLEEERLRKIREEERLQKERQEEERLQKEREDEERERKLKEVKCFIKSEHNSASELKDDLRCPDDTVCDIDSGICKKKEESEITQIQIDGEIIPVSGKDDIINRIKQKILQLTQSSKSVEDVEQIIPAQQTNLPDIIDKLQNVLIKSPVTTAQNKIKMADRAVLEKIAKCAGVKI